MSSFDIISEYYDTIISDRNIDSIYLDIFNTHVKDAKKVLDLGCGTGKFLSKIVTSEKIGVDISEQMIKQARIKNPDCLFLKSDLRYLELKNQTYDFVVSMYDVINNIKKIEDWRKLFVNVYNSLNKNGIFAFDINTQERMESVLKASPMIKVFGCDNFSITIVKQINNSNSLFKWEHLLVVSRPNGNYVFKHMNNYELTPAIDDVYQILTKIFRKIDTVDIDKMSGGSIGGKKIFICFK